MESIQTFLLNVIKLTDAHCSFVEHPESQAIQIEATQQGANLTT